LAVLGCELKLDLWDKGYAKRNRNPEGKKTGMTVQLTGANYFKAPEKRPAVAAKPASIPSPAPTAIPVIQISSQQKSSNSTSPKPLDINLPANSGSMQQALIMTRQSMQALQKLQEDTSRLHQRFLEGQEEATRSMLSLVDQQRRLLHGQPLAEAGEKSDTQRVDIVRQAPASAAKVVVPKAAVPPAPVKAPTPSPTIDSGKVSKSLLEVIAEKTGYPVDMLELGMALDTDLGIDSIKRVEILSALQEKLPEAPAVRPEDLGSLQTLGQIVDFLNAGMSAAAPVAQSQAPAAPATAIDSAKVSEALLEVIAEKTGYPVDMLELGMTLDTDLGIDSIKRVEILSALQEKLPEAPAVRPEDLGSLQTLGQIVDFLNAGMRAAAPVAQSQAPAAPATAIDSAKVSEALLEVIAEKTGYPVDMLELGMTLDTDLGIDSIKRVEILSALQEKLPEAPAVRPEDLGSLQTLGQIVDFLNAGMGGAVSAPAAQAPAQTVDSTEVSEALLEVIAEKTGYPVDMLELGMTLDTDLGIDSIKRVEILSALQEKLPEAPAVKPEHLGTLQTLGQIVDFLTSVAGAGSSLAVPISKEDSFKPAAGVERQVLKLVPFKPKNDRNSLVLPEGSRIWIVEEGSELTDKICHQLECLKLEPIKIKTSEIDKLVAPDELAGLLIPSPSEGTDDLFLQRAFSIMQMAGPALNRAADKSGAFFTSISRLNGSFGLSAGNEQTADPLSGGLAGLSKTAAHEWQNVKCKAIDIAQNLADVTATAGMIIEEALADGPVETGISSRGLVALKLSPASLPEEIPAAALLEGDLVVVSGGARGVTAEVAISVAESSRCTMLLLGRTTLPDAEPTWLANLSAESEIKKAIIDNAGTPLKPVDVQRSFNAIKANGEIRNTIERIDAAGGKALYRSVDLRDAKAVEKVIEDVRSECGPVRGLIHGAGVLADRLIKDKTLDQFEMVYSTKVEGLRSLLDAVKGDELRFMVMFSSSTGRFGRTGQVDYAVANEVLNKMAQKQAMLRPDCRVLSLNWGPWDGGMVTPALKKVFEEEGVAVIDLKAGADYLLKEIATPAGGPVELVILGGREEAEEEVQPEAQQNIYVSKAFDLEISIDQYPFLRSHVMDSKAVLPMAMMVEWMAHGAIHNNPGLRFHGFNDLRVLKGVALEEGQTHSLQVMTGKSMKSGGSHVVPVELSGKDEKGKEFIHARAKIVLATKLPEAKKPAAQLELAEYSRAVEDIYKEDRLFHGPDFHSIREIEGYSEAGISSLVRPAPLPSQWINQPLRNSWLADPLAIDSSFQMMILWSFERYKAGSLPVFTGRYRQYREHFPEKGAEIRIRITDHSASKARADIDFIDPLSGALIARIEDYECVIDASLNESFQRNKLEKVA
jgi:acyl carrier protein/NAD(P)-dependent dehydrogenase (short-subunit alcohol dehydrogenase family)